MMAEQNDGQAGVPVYEEVEHEGREHNKPASPPAEGANRQPPATVHVIVQPQRQPPPPPQQNQQRQVILPRNDPEQRERDPLLDQGQRATAQDGEAENLYNFKGFMLFCFGAPGVSSKPCSCLLFFYYMLLFTVGVAWVILGAVALEDLTDKSRRPFLRANILVILSGLLYILAAFHGGCIWAWRTNVVPLMYPVCFPLLGIIALMLSFAHVALMSAFVSVMIGYGKDMIDANGVELHILAPITLGTLVIWAIIFVIGLLPAFLLFRRRYRPRNNGQE